MILLLIQSIIVLRVTDLKAAVSGKCQIPVDVCRLLYVVQNYRSTMSFFCRFACKSKMVHDNWKKSPDIMTCEKKSLYKVNKKLIVVLEERVRILGETVPLL